MSLSGDTAAAQVAPNIDPSDGISTTTATASASASASATTAIDASVLPSDAISTVTVTDSASAIDAAVTPVDDVTQRSNSQTNNSNTQNIISNSISNSISNNVSESNNTEGEQLATAVMVDDSKVVVADPVVVRPPEGDDTAAGIAEASSGFRKACVGMTIAVVVLAAVVIGVAVIGGGDPLITVTDGGTPVVSDLPPDGTGAAGGDVVDDVDDRREALIALLAPLYEGREGGTGIFDLESGLPGSEDRVLALEWLLADAIEVPELDDIDGALDDFEVEGDDDAAAAIGNSNETTTFVVDDGGGGNEQTALSYEDRVLRVMERYVLALLYFAMEGDGWFDTLWFLEDSDVCSWNSRNEDEIKGVICNDRGQIRELWMYWNNLAGTIPHELSLFADDLLTLNVGGGSIGGTIPTELAELTNLESLGLNDHCLEGTVPRDLIEIPSLSVMLFSNNNHALVYGPADEDDDEEGGTALNDRICDGNVLREDIIATTTDCRPDDDGFAEDAPCGCCICCDPASYSCTDRASGGSYTSLFERRSPKTGFLMPFESRCLSEDQRSWIDSDCPCIVESIYHPINDSYQCTNCTVDGAIPSLPPPPPSRDRRRRRRRLLRN